MDHPVLDHPALKRCFQDLRHLFIEFARLKEEPEYEERGGGYGDVRVCTLDSETMESKLVAVKTIRLRAHHKEPLRLVFRLARELKVWARLQHPHVLPVLGYYIDSYYRTAVLISEYQVRGDLKDYLEREDPSWDIRLQLIRDSTDGLAYLHSQDPPIRHGDLKPGNVLISVERRAMLADFGLSQTLEDEPTGLTTSSGLKGTVRYFSPELLEQGVRLDLSSDMWAWACLALEGLTDRTPYATRTGDAAVILALASGELPSETESLPIHVPDLKLLLSKCWSSEPAERPSAVYCLGILNSTSSMSHTSDKIESNAGHAAELTLGRAKSGVPSTIPESSTGSAPRPGVRWVKGELIGKGTFGRVFLALNATTGEMMAIKQVEMPQTISDLRDLRQVSIVKALEAEQQTLQKVEHPNIVQYLGFEKTKEFFNVFLEYVPGGSIGGCLRQFGKFEEDIIKSFTGQIIDGLAYLHANNIIHGNIKAYNVLVETSGNCKISDFGIWKLSEEISDNAAMAVMQDSIFWMAPELLPDYKNGCNIKMDIWSLGCVFFEMFAGRRPWEQDDFGSVMIKVSRNKMAPPVPSDVHLSAGAESFRLKCFTWDPEERPTAEGLKDHVWLDLPPGWIFPGFHS